jgi:hypothetical protein
MTASPTQMNDSARASAGDSAATEHLAHLPKMSPTAGVTEQDYVAINAVAVVSLLAGLASILAVINDILAVIPLVGLFMAIVGLRQIAGSNGTQSGRGIGMAGLFLCTAFLSYVVATDVSLGMARRADREAIAQLSQQFGQDVSDHAYDSAYDLFSQRFKSRVSRQEFVSKLKGMQDRLIENGASGQGLGPVTGASWNGLAQFFIDNDSGSFTAGSEIAFHFRESVATEPMGATFRKAGGTWTIDSLPTMFPAQHQ